MVNDLRLTKPKSNKHKDFDTFIHNNTNETLKYFDKNKYKWDIAIYRQGYYDYNTIFTDSKQLISNRQYLFIKFNNKLAREICLNLIDYENLSQKNTTTPGFSLTDFVEEYEKQKTYLYLSHIKNKII